MSPKPKPKAKRSRRIEVELVNLKDRRRVESPPKLVEGFNYYQNRGVTSLVAKKPDSL